MLIASCMVIAKSSVCSSVYLPFTSTELPRGSEQICHFISALIDPQGQLFLTSVRFLVGHTGDVHTDEVIVRGV